jgi:hypothetical protein
MAQEVDSAWWHGCLPGVGRQHGAHGLVRAGGGRRPHHRWGWR